MSNKPRCVLDTSVLVSAALFKRSVPSRAMGMALVRGTIPMSTETYKEAVEVLFREKFTRMLSIAQRTRFLERLSMAAERVDVVDDIRACRDPRDDKFLSLAIAGRATCIVTGDNDLLVLSPFQGIAILTPAEFIAQNNPAV